MLRCGFFVPGKLTPKEIKFPVQNWQSILFNFNRTETALPSADTSAWLWQDKSRPYLLNDLLETEKTKKSGHVHKHNTPILYSTNRKLRPPAAMNASGGLNLFEKRFKNPKTLKIGGKRLWSFNSQSKHKCCELIIMSPWNSSFFGKPLEIQNKVCYNISHVGAGIPVVFYVFWAHEYQEMLETNPTNLPAFFYVLPVRTLFNFTKAV